MPKSRNYVLSVEVYKYPTFNLKLMNSFPGQEVIGKLKGVFGVIKFFS